MSENIYYTVKLGQTKENPWAIKNGKSIQGSHLVQKTSKIRNVPENQSDKPRTSPKGTLKMWKPT